MVKQLGILTYFLTFSCADLRWEEFPHTLNKLNNLELSGEKLKHLSYQERCNLLNNSPVLVARYCQYKIQISFVEMVPDKKLRKTRYYALRIEFQERCIPYVLLFIWIFNASDIHDEAA